MNWSLTEHREITLRVLKENITQQPSFDPLLRHLHRKKKNSVFHKSDSSKKKIARISYIIIRSGLDLYSRVWIIEYFVNLLAPEFYI